MHRYLRYVRFPLICCLIGLVAVFASHGGFSPQGVQAAWVTLVLLVLEISLSFDNAVVNARVLETMTPGQQRFFLSWGLVIPVFGVRFLGPLLLVSLAGHIGVAAALDAALHDHARYHELLKLAEPRILAFGGMFLLMVFLRYFFDEAKTLHWVQQLEKRLSAAGRVPSLEVAVALVILMVVSAVLPVVPVGLRSDVLFAGLIGLVLQILSTSLADLFGGEEEAVGRMAVNGGLASLIYLELLDASFSLDGTIGAFAITSDLGLIMTGLGLGALFIRSLTVMISREKALDQLIYLEHGAHYAIGALGLLMLAGVVIGRWGWHVPEWLSGLIGVVLLLLALADSLRHNRRAGA